MKRRIFHLHIKPDTNKYYGSLQALFLDNKDLKVSKFTLDRYDFVKPFENEVCVINKGFVLSAGDIRGLAPKWQASHIACRSLGILSWSSPDNK
jgi:hypothetical protein